MNKWWQLGPENFCLFSLDSDTVISAEGSTALFSNPTENFLVTESGSKNKLKISEVVDFEDQALTSLRSFHIEESNLILNEEIILPDVFTWILYVKPNDDFSSLAAGPGGINHWGFEFRRNFSNKQGWNFKGLSLSNPVDLPKIQKVALRVNRVSKTFSVFKNYPGDFSEPSTGSFLSDSSSFANIPSLKYLGYSGSDWAPSVDIIGFGLFSGWIEDEGVESIFNDLVRQFQTSKKLLRFREDPEKFLGDYRLKNTSFSKSELQHTTNYHAAVYKETIKVIPEIRTSVDMNTISVYYKDSYNLSDIITKEDLPVATRVFLYERFSGRLVRFTESNIRGEFTFFNLNKNLEYVVTSHDMSYEFKSIIKNY